ncbi:MAG: baseplate wedge protein 53, partial [Candidatus Peribacteraceae bacterium]|nr:baseplate wedge protein 53 [Candidatus Peribacteraceae bacterium]
MPYFQRFPEITYMGLKITDISFRVALYEKLNSNVSSFEPYRIKNGDKIEDLAHKLYGNSNLFWIIMITNNLTDPFYDWPLNDLELDEYIVGKYGIGN